MLFSRAFVTIAAADWPRSVAFYTALTGDSPRSVIPGRYGEFMLAGLQLAIYQPKTLEITLPERYPILSICLQVPDLDEAIGELGTIGYPVSMGIQKVSHGCEVYIYDPDGNRLILYQPNLLLPKAEQHGNEPRL
jgi:predicted enzyme related to lactoylglutathione lyase